MLAEPGWRDGARRSILEFDSPDCIRAWSLSMFRLGWPLLLLALTCCGGEPQSHASQAQRAVDYLHGLQQTETEAAA